MSLKAVHKMLIKLTTKETIKSRSKFPLIFQDIYNKVIDSIDNESNETIINNSKYAPQVIIKLIENFMPYCFIWASFVLFGLLLLIN